MSRADDIRARHESELAVAVLEDELVAAKDAGDDLADVKARLREARRVYRLQREGDATAVPDTIAVSTVIDPTAGA